MTTHLFAPKEGVNGVQLEDDVEDVEAFGGEEGEDEVEVGPLHATPSSRNEDALFEVAVEDVDDFLADDLTRVLLQTHHHFAQLFTT